MNEEFDGSALRALLEPAVVDRGAAAAPTDAIVSAGERRVRGRRLAAAGGTLAIVAAVPLAASAIAAGPDAARTTAGSGGAPAARTSTGTSTTAPDTTTTLTTPQATHPTRTKPAAPPLGPLPKTPKLLAEGTLDGKKWTVSGVESKGNNELTKNSRCFKLLITDGGRDRDAALGDMLLYCDVSSVGEYLLNAMQDDVPGGSGNLAIGTAPAQVAKIVARVEGVADPVTVQTVPAPGADGTVIYIVPAGTRISPKIDFDEYDAQGTKIGSFDNHSHPSNMLGDQLPH